MHKPKFLLIILLLPVKYYTFNSTCMKYTGFISSLKDIPHLKLMRLIFELSKYRNSRMDLLFN